MAETILLVDILTLHGVVSTSLNQQTLFSLVLVLTRKLVLFSLDLNNFRNYRTVVQRSQGKYQTLFNATKVFFNRNKLWRRSLRHSWTRRACTAREPAYLPYGLACLPTCTSGWTACSPTLRAGLPPDLLCGLTKHKWRSLWLHYVIEKTLEIWLKII